MIRFCFLILFSILIFSNCNYVTFRRNINVNLNDTGVFNQTSTFSKKYTISTGKIINAVAENINASSARIEKLEIKAMKIEVNLLPGNTATSVHNISFTLAQGFSEKKNLISVNESVKFINTGSVFVLNKFIEGKILLGFKNDLAKGLATGKSEFFDIDMKGSIPAGQLLKCSIQLQIEASVEAVTCEQVPFGLGPSECL